MPTNLQPHQTSAIDKLDTTDRLLIYHDMGSGKTLTALGAAKKLKAKATVIGPASLKDNFAKEKAKHKINVPVSYHSYSKPPVGKEHDLLIYDEAHLMGQSTSKRSHYPDEYRGKKEIYMTGTPIRNHPSELAPIMRGLGVPISRDPKAFSQKFIEEKKVYPGIAASLFRGVKPGVEYSAKNLAVLRDSLKGKVHYYKPSQTDYPAINKEVIKTEMSPKQLVTYKALMKGQPSLKYKIQHGLPTGKTESHRMNAFLNATRQISNTPRAYNATTLPTDAPKLNRAASEIKMRYMKNPRYRGVTYSNYLQSGVDPMSERLTRMGVPHRTFTGRLTDKQKKLAVEDFNSGQVKHLIVSGAGSEGLDLKGVRLMQILEPHWNTPKINQVSARGVRYKSHEHLPQKERNVTIQNYVSTVPKTKFLKRQFKSSDEYMYELSNKKQQLNKQFLDTLKTAGVQKDLYKVMRDFKRKAESVRTKKEYQEFVTYANSPEYAEKFKKIDLSSIPQETAAALSSPQAMMDFVAKAQKNKW